MLIFVQKLNKYTEVYPNAPEQGIPLGSAELRRTRMQVQTFIFRPRFEINFNIQKPNKTIV